MDKTKLYVGNINFDATSKDLIKLFSSYGEVAEAMVIPDKRRPGKSKGFGFVTFHRAEEAKKSLDLNGKAFMERELVVRYAKEDINSDKEDLGKNLIYESEG